MKYLPRVKCCSYVLSAALRTQRYPDGIILAHVCLRIPIFFDSVLTDTYHRPKSILDPFWLDQDVSIRAVLARQDVSWLDQDLTTSNKKVANLGNFLVLWAWQNQGVTRGKGKGRRKREGEERREEGGGRVAVLLWQRNSTETA